MFEGCQIDSERHLKHFNNLGVEGVYILGCTLRELAFASKWMPGRGITQTLTSPLRLLAEYILQCATSMTPDTPDTRPRQPVSCRNAPILQSPEGQDFFWTALRLPRYDDKNINKRQATRLPRGIAAVLCASVLGHSWQRGIFGHWTSQITGV